MVLSILGRNTWTIVHEQWFQMGRVQIDYIARGKQHKVCCRTVQDRCNTEQWMKEICGCVGDDGQAEVVEFGLAPGQHDR